MFVLLAFVAVAIAVGMVRRISIFAVALVGIGAGSYVDVVKHDIRRRQLACPDSVVEQLKTSGGRTVGTAHEYLQIGMARDKERVRNQADRRRVNLLRFCRVRMS